MIAVKNHSIRIVDDYVGAYKHRASPLTSKQLPLRTLALEAVFSNFRFPLLPASTFVRIKLSRFCQLLPTNKRSSTFTMEATNYEAKEALEGVSSCFFVRPTSKHSDTNGSAQSIGHRPAQTRKLIFAVNKRAEAGGDHHEVNMPRRHASNGTGFEDDPPVDMEAGGK